MFRWIGYFKKGTIVRDTPIRLDWKYFKEGEEEYPERVERVLILPDLESNPAGEAFRLLEEWVENFESHFSGDDEQAPDLYWSTLKFLRRDYGKEEKE